MDKEYARRCAMQEREAALKATHPKARELHLELAKRLEGQIGEPLSS
jgi:hypothetical protein